MSDIARLSDSEQNFLKPYLPPQHRHSDKPSVNTQDEVAVPGDSDHMTRSSDVGKPDLPFVTLTYASSLDSMISLAPGVRTTLSGPETKSMTHYLRLHHDAILIGVGTALADDPSLNCRYPGVTLEQQPRPVVVDPQFRWSPRSAKVMKLAAGGQGKAPWIVNSPREVDSENLREVGGQRLMMGEGRIVGTPQHDILQHEASQIFDWTAILKSLKHKGIDSVMIEGGATIINTLLSRPDLVDCVIVTIAPTWLGKGGVVVSPPAKTQNGNRANAARLKGTAWRQFGADAVLCGRPQT